MVAIGRIVEVRGGGGGRLVRSMGRKDRHSKVFTSKGPRDRRVRLSALTAIQFYDVQDRLGFDRPSEAVDWLMQKARASIEALKPEPLEGLENNIGQVDNNVPVRNQAVAAENMAGVSSMTLEEFVKARDGNGQERLQDFRHSNNVGHSTNMISDFSSMGPLGLLPGLMENAIGGLSSYASFQSQGCPILQELGMSRSDENILFLPLPNTPAEDSDNSSANCWPDEEVFNECEFQKTILVNQKFSSPRDALESRYLSAHQAAAPLIWEINDQYNQVKPTYTQAQFRASDHKRQDLEIS